MKHISLLALTIALFGVSACGTVKGGAKDIQIVGENIGAVATGDVVPPYDEEGNPQFSIGAMPEGYNYGDNPNDLQRLGVASHNARVDLYHPDTGMVAGPRQMHEMTMPSYAGGVNVSDSSVTIYPLNQQMQNTFQGYAPTYNPLMNNHNYMPQSFAPIMPDMGFGTDTQIFFKNGSARLGKGDLNKLSSVADDAKMVPSGMVTVEGHASRAAKAGGRTVNGRISNLKESMNRSFAVSSALMKKGVPAESIKTVSWGSARATGIPSHDRRVDVTMGER